MVRAVSRGVAEALLGPANAPIQNNSGLPQGPSSLSVAG